MRWRVKVTQTFASMSGFASGEQERLVQLVYYHEKIREGGGEHRRDSGKHGEVAHVPGAQETGDLSQRSG